MATPLATNAAHPEGLSLRTDTRPWYRQFWPWFLIALPAISVAGSFASLSLALRHADVVVSEPGYELSRFAVEHPVTDGKADPSAPARTAPLHPDAHALPDQARTHP